MNKEKSLLEILTEVLRQYEMEFEGEVYTSYTSCGICGCSYVLYGYYAWNLVFDYCFKFIDKENIYLFGVGEIKPRIEWLKKHIEILSK